MPTRCAVSGVPGSARLAPSGRGWATGSVAEPSPCEHRAHRGTSSCSTGALGTCPPQPHKRPHRPSYVLVRPDGAATRPLRPAQTTQRPATTSSELVRKASQTSSDLTNLVRPHNDAARPHNDPAQTYQRPRATAHEGRGWMSGTCAFRIVSPVPGMERPTFRIVSVRGEWGCGVAESSRDGSPISDARAAPW